MDLTKRFLALKDFEPAARALLPRPIFGNISGVTDTNASLRDNLSVFAFRESGH
jgi:L-lactate dehydrogenase (cytochrome)